MLENAKVTSLRSTRHSKVAVACRLDELPGTTRLFVITIETSDLPFIKKYSEALEEWRS